MNSSLSNINPLSKLLASERITEANINELADKITADILEESNGVDELVLMNALKKVCEGVDARLRKKVDVCYAYPVFKGVGITTSNTGVTLNLEEDAEYLRLKEDLKKRGELLKSAYKSNSTIEFTDKENGEVIPIVSVKKGKTETINLTFPKQ